MEKREYLLDVSHNHPFESRDGKRNGSYDVHPFLNTNGNGVGQYTIRRGGNIPGTTRKYAERYIDRDLLAEIFSIDGFYEFGIIIRMHSSSYPSNSSSGLTPRKSDVKAGTDFSKIVQSKYELIQSAGISIELRSLLGSMSIPVPNKFTVSSGKNESAESFLASEKPNSVFVDQFGLDDLPSGDANKKESTSQVYERSPQVRQYVLKRANGYCEWCGDKGFTTSSGSIYLETHHIQPLSEEGEDSVFNVIALCPNHHREAHFGENFLQTRQALFDRIERLGMSKQQASSNG